MAAVVFLVLGGVLLWYFKHRSRENSRRGRPPVLASGPNSPTLGAHSDPRMSAAANAQGALSSHFYAPSHVASQVAYMSPQTGRPSAPQKLVSNNSATYGSAGSGSNPSEASHNPSATLTSSTIPQSPSWVTNLSSTPAGPGAQQGSRINEKSPHGWPRYTVQNPTTPTPLPSGVYSSAMSGDFQTQIPNEPVEQGLMSRHISTRSTLPPYSPGGLQRDESMPPLPGR